jgi:hypothetical protein
VLSLGVFVPLFGIVVSLVISASRADKSDGATDPGFGKSAATLNLRVFPNYILLPTCACLIIC